MVWYLLRNVENIASSVGSIAQYRFSLCRKVVQWTSSRVNNYDYGTEIRRQEVYFGAYRSLSFFTGFVECQEQGLQEQNKKMNNKNICFANIERDFRMPIKITWLKNLNLCVPTAEKDWSWLVWIASRMIVFLFIFNSCLIIFSNSSNHVASSRRKFWKSRGSLSLIFFNKFSLVY
jgi:hypothetical protein